MFALTDAVFTRVLPGASVRNSFTPLTTPSNVVTPEAFSLKSRPLPVTSARVTAGAAKVVPMPRSSSSPIPMNVFALTRVVLIRVLPPKSVINAPTPLTTPFKVVAPEAFSVKSLPLPVTPARVNVGAAKVVPMPRSS